MAQFGVGLHPGRTSLLAPVGALLVTACGGGLVVAVLGQLVPRTQRAVRSRIAKRRKLRTAASAEVRARAMMDELCPYGWRAQITMFGAHEVPPSSSSGRRPDRVALDWTAFEDDSLRVSVVRRVWAPTIGDALDAMVADRRTDETLQQIEQAAHADGALWPDA